MKFEITIEPFTIKPCFWKLRQPFTGDQAKYFGHTWAFSISWLWFELLVYGLPNNRIEQTSRKAAHPGR